ncbi:MAG: class I SAM-dependent methyltransferase [Burkholderiales bacterium]
MNDLPDPGTDALIHSARVTDHIRRAIANAGGWISFERYMDLALHAPGLGYYAAGAAKFGAAGDFVTAPEISSLFGQTLAVQVGEVLAASGAAVLEFGAGSGRLAADLLCALGRSCGEYLILETSPDLRERQARTLSAAGHAGRVRWLDVPPTQFAGCLIANEVLDAMPVQVVAQRGRRWVERGVRADGRAGFAWADGPDVEGVAAIPDAADFPGGYQTEINRRAPAWVDAVGRTLTHGAALVVDYGFAAAEYYHPQRSGGTLMCHTRHRAHTDPFFMPGLTDITAHLDFSSLAGAARGAGLEVLGYATQANFLINCGITDLLAQTPASDAVTYLPLANQANRLLSPAEMGELFKVIAFGRGIEDALTGFTRGDRRHTLSPCAPV